MNTKKVFKPVNNRKIKVAMFTNGPELPTGYARVLRELAKRIVKDNNFEVIIFNETSFHREPYSFMGIPVYSLPIKIVNGQADRGSTAEAVVKLLEEHKPDVLWILEDSFTLHNLGFDKIIRLPTKRVFYIPLDGKFIPDIGVNPLRTMDKIVSMSKFTQDSLHEEGFESAMIWHGVELDLFTPVSPKYQAQLKQKYGFRPDDFVLFNYGRNTNIRKNNQGLMWILAKYLSTAPKNHKAFLHILDPQFEGNDLFDYRDRVLSLEFSKDVLDRIIFSNFRSDQPATDNDVAEMIQMSDLIVSASIGEGFGLIMAEAMACAKPIVHNEYTTPKELIADTSMGIGPRGWVVPTNNTFVASLNTEHAYSDRDAFVRMLNQVVTDRQEMFIRGQNGRLFAEKYLNWDYLAEEWKKIFREVI